MSGGGRTGSELDHDRRRGVVRRTMMDCLEVVAVGVEDERGVVARVIVPGAWGAVVAATRGERRCVERVDHGAVLGLEREVMPAGQHAGRRWAGLRRDEQLVITEVVVAG